MLINAYTCTQFQMSEKRSFPSHRSCFLKYLPLLTQLCACACPNYSYTCVRVRGRL